MMNLSQDLLVLKTKAKKPKVDTKLPKVELKYESHITEEVIEALTPEIEEAYKNYRERYGSTSKSMFTVDNLNQLYRAWEIGCDDNEAAQMIGVRPSTLKTYLSQSEELREIKDSLNAQPRVMAKHNVYNKLKNDAKGEFSLRYLEKVKPEEFGGKGAVVNINNDNRSVTIEDKMAKITELLESIG